MYLIRSNKGRKNYVVLAFSQLIVVLSLVQVPLLFGQNDVKARIFQETEMLLKQAKGEQADLLSPTNYAGAIEKYEDASREFDHGKNVQKKIEETNDLLTAAIENSKIARLTFSHLLAAREDALEANAIEFSQDLYEKAENEFLNTAKVLEKGSVNKAKEQAIKVEQLFREAELVAIKASIIGNVKNLLAQAYEENVHKYAPISLKSSQALLLESEKILNSDRSAKTEAREKAEAARYEANHAMYLANLIKSMEGDETNWEKLILKHENYMAQLLANLGFKPAFDEGFETPMKSANLAIQNLKQEIKQLSDEISSQDQMMASLQSDLNNLKIELDKSKEKQEGLKAKLLLEEQEKDKFKKIESILGKEQAKVFREGDQVRIRLLGLNFNSGNAIIEPDYFNLLTQLQRVIRLFPNNYITIEGHTDNVGDERLNQSLSLKRAKAVMTYLMANMQLSVQQISALGYGESKPIASNETSVGRAQNRRIDVVLSPTP
ncbi:MAG: OmpA family protein [Candidatus Zhuqueibacterota bacterium]